MATKHHQQGVVLIVGLVSLVLLTLMAVAAFKFGKSGFIVVANQQLRTEALRAGQQVIEQIIGNQEIELSRGNALFQTPLPGAGSVNNLVPIDINGDAQPDYMVSVTAPTCVRRSPIMQASLNFSNANDLGCVRSLDQASMGIEGSASGESMCSEVTWDLRVQAQDLMSGNVAVTVVQGLGQRVATTSVSLVCD